MTEPIRSDRHASGADRERDARIEELLVLGLDHYFAEQHELAINVWTRVLFIDRGHARARAYIERARSAVAERQRKGDELLHTGVAALDRGDAGAARELVASAVEHGAAADEALALLARIERLETAAPLTRPQAPLQRRGYQTSDDDAAAPAGRARLKWIAVGVLAGVVLGAGLLAFMVEREVIRWPFGAPSHAVAGSPLTSTLPVPSPAELAFSRARSLHARGRLHDALAALEPISYGDAVRPRADELKTVIQRQLLERAGPDATRTGRASSPMRCPKCQYISFDNGDSCRNCGYQFSLAVEAEPPAPDLPIQTGAEPEGPLVDLSFGERLPLFGDSTIGHQDRPMVIAPAAPRAPLAVRKAAPAVARSAAAAPRPVHRRSVIVQEPELDLGPPEAVPLPVPSDAVVVEPEIDHEPESTPAAPAARRMLAALIDLTIIGAIDAAVLHFTLKLCGLQYSEIAVVPAAPFAAFLLLLNGGYVVAFTVAGGQSIGKMIAGIKVVSADSGGWTDRVGLGQAVLRSAAYLVSALPAGLGFLPALVGADKRAIHDRLAHTRVVKA